MWIKKSLNKIFAMFTIFFRSNSTSEFYQFSYAYPCLLGEIRSPLARIDSVDEFSARADDDTRLRFKDELGFSSSSPSSYLVLKNQYFSDGRF